MKSKTYVKNKKSDLKMYKHLEFDAKKSLAERKKRIATKKPTSVALDEETIAQLKELAEERGIPYQVLMRSYILKGLKEDLAS